MQIEMSPRNIHLLNVGLWALFFIGFFLLRYLRKAFAHYDSIDRKYRPPAWYSLSEGAILLCVVFWLVGHIFHFKAGNKILSPLDVIAFYLTFLVWSGVLLILWAGMIAAIWKKAVERLEGKDGRHF